MYSSTLSVNFAFADSTSKIYSMGPFDGEKFSLQNFKTRLKNFDKTDSETGKKFTNLAEILKSDNGYELTGIKSATVVTSTSTRIFDAGTYSPT